MQYGRKVNVNFQPASNINKQVNYTKHHTKEGKLLPYTDVKVINSHIVMKAIAASLSLGSLVIC